MALKAVKVLTRTLTGAKSSNMRLPRTLQSGFTLLEIMVVVVRAAVVYRDIRFHTVNVTVCYSVCCVNECDCFD